MNRTIAITGIGVVSPYGEGNREFCKRYNMDNMELEPLHAHRFGGSIPAFQPKELLGLKRIAMFNRATLILMEAFHFLNQDFPQAVRPGDPDESDRQTGSIIGFNGSFQSISHLDFTILEDPYFIQPSDFPNCVACATLGQVSIKEKVRAFNETVSSGTLSTIDAMSTVEARLSTGNYLDIIAGGLEELTEAYSRIRNAVDKRVYGKEFQLSEGAAIFRCERMEDAVERQADILAEVLGCTSCFGLSLKEGIANNLSILAERLSGDGIESITDVFLSHKYAVDISDMMHHPVREHNTYDALGDLYSADSSFKLATTIASERIPSGARVLIWEYNEFGGCGCMVVEKK